MEKLHCIAVLVGKPASDGPRGPRKTEVQGRNHNSQQMQHAADLRSFFALSDQPGTKLDEDNA